VPLDEKTAAAPTTGHVTPVPVIDNEIPAYRAISPGGIFSLILGVLSILSYTSQWFLLFAAGAIVLGALTVAKIRRMPDVLTGERFAQTGIVLGLIFGLTSFTITTVQGLLREREARTFARQFETVLTSAPLQDSIWWSQNPERRRNVKPKELLAGTKGQGQEAQMLEMQVMPFRNLKARIEEPGAHLEFVKIENHADNGTGTDATALYHIRSPNRKQVDERDIYVLAVLKGAQFKGKTEWWVDTIACPYKPQSYIAPEKPVDEHGHGGEHGGH
jgi:hypothetical protein